MTRWVLGALLSHWRRNLLQLLTLVAGLALATALWSGVQAVNSEARASYDAAASTLGEGQFDQLIASDGGSISQSEYVALRRAGWLVSPVIEGRYELPDGRFARLIGIDPVTAPGSLGPVEAGSVDLAEFVSGRGKLLAAADVAEPLNAAPLAEMAPGLALGDIGVVQEMLGRPGEISRLLIAPEQPVGRGPLLPGLSLQKGGDETDLAGLTDSFHLNLTAFGLLAFAVGIFIVHGAIGLAFEQRRPMMRTLRALGLPLSRLIWCVALEMTVLALVAGAIGVLLGYWVAAILMPDVAATLRGIYGAEVAGSLSLRPGWWLSGLAMALGGTAIAAGGGLWKMARMPLLASAQARAWSLASGRGRLVQGIGAVALLCLSTGLVIWGQGLIAGFGALASLLIGAALVLPLMLGLLLRLGGSLSKGAISQWFWADSRQQLPGLSLALMALLLAMAANVGVSTMVSSFRLTFVEFINQRLSSELYIYADDPVQARELEAFVTPLVDGVLPIISVTQDFAGVPSDIYGARAHATYGENWRFLTAIERPWAALHRSDGMLVSEQLARRAGLALGDVVPIEGRDFTIVGIHSDYGNPIGQVILGEDTFKALFPGAVPGRFGLRIAPDQVDAVQVALVEEFGLPRANIRDQAAMKAFSMEIFERTFTVTEALNVLTLAVAGFAILMSLLTLAAMRLPQLAPVWALGMTRVSLGRLEMARALMLALLTTLLAIPLGLALAWVLLAIVNVEAFGWRLPMFFFPMDYLRLTGFALAAAMLAALWPARKLAKTPPSALLQVFAHER